MIKISVQHKQQEIKLILGTGGLKSISCVCGWVGRGTTMEEGRNDYRMHKSGQILDWEWTSPTGRAQVPALLAIAKRLKDKEEVERLEALRPQAPV